VEHRGRGNGEFRGPRRYGVEEAEVVDHDRLAVAQLPGERRNRRLLLGAAELRSRVLPQRHALETGEEIEVPPVAAEFAVGDRGEADRLLSCDRLADRVLLERAVIAPACLGEPARAQQAADMIGVERGSHA
jgi:hypothetical protein